MIGSDFMSLAKKLKQFNQAGMAGVKRATEAENKPVHYVPGDSSSFTNNVRSRTFNPVSSGGGSYVPMATTPTTSAPSNSYNYPTAQTSQPFNSKWSDELNAMYEQIKNKPKFSYDQSKDPLYQQYAAMYQKNAQLAMNDTMARASALTGGYGNSYAQTAGQQMYNQQMDQLNDKALDLYYAALDKYNAENDDLYKQFGLAGQMYGYDYNAWRDQMADSRWAQEFNYGAYRDSISDRRYDDETAYNRGVDARNYNYQLSRDAVSDARYNSEWQHQLEREGIEDKRYDDEQALRYYQARYDPLTGGMSELGQQERAYELLQNQLDRDLQYYQAGYDPKTKGMSAEARQQYELGLKAQGIDPATGGRTQQSMLEYLAANGNNDAIDSYVDSLNVSASEKARLKNMYHTSNSGGEGDNVLKGLTATTQAFVNNNTLPTREAFEAAKTMVGPVSWATGGRTKKGFEVGGEYYNNYDKFIDAWLDENTHYSEAEKDYLYWYYTNKE